MCLVYRFHVRGQSIGKFSRYAATFHPLVYISRSSGEHVADSVQRCSAIVLGTRQRLEEFFGSSVAISVDIIVQRREAWNVGGDNPQPNIFQDFSSNSFGHFCGRNHVAPFFVGFLAGVNQSTTTRSLVALYRGIPRPSTVQCTVATARLPIPSSSVIVPTQ